MKRVINIWSWAILLALCVSLSSCSKDKDGGSSGVDYLIGTWKSDIPHSGGEYYYFTQNANGSGKAEGNSNPRSGTDLAFKWEKLENKGGKLVGSNSMSSIEWKAVLKSHTSTQLVFDDFFGWGYVVLNKIQ